MSSAVSSSLARTLAALTLLGQLATIQAQATRPATQDTPAAPTAQPLQAESEAVPSLMLNEVDADQPGNDLLEFVELHSSVPRMGLSGHFLVLYDGRTDGDSAYAVIDLYGHATDREGLLVIGSPRVDRTHLVAFSRDGLRNTDCGLALFRGIGLLSSDFARTPAGAPPAGAVLLDALVCGPQTDPSLAETLGVEATITEERGESGSLQRVPDGGEARDVTAWLTGEPSPGELNGRPLTVAIHDIQGRSHVSPLRGRIVRDVEGIVTSAQRGGFTLQQAPGSEDDDPATSEAVLVATGPFRVPTPGNRVRVSGRVEEFLPGAVETNLTTTRILLQETWTLVADSVDLPQPVPIGTPGRRPPPRGFDDDTPGGLVGSGPVDFDPENDGLDFWESLESMRLRLDDARIVDHTSSYGELVVVPAGFATAPGGLLIAREDDFHPERLLLDDTLVRTPAVDGGDVLDGPAVGVLDYGFGAYRLLLTEAVGVRPGDVPAAPVPEVDESFLTLASFNVENLSPRSEPARVEQIAQRIVDDLRAPDLLALQEVQDDSGPIDDGVTSAASTLAMLIDAVVARGGPRYRALEIAPDDGADGGQPGGNIRVALLFRPDRGIEFAPRPRGTSPAGLSLVSGLDGGPRLAGNPMRVEPSNPAWRRSRKPLAASFHWGERTLFLIVVHLSSRGGDDPLQGAFQPPRLASQDQRSAQTRVLADFTGRILELDPRALVVVLGDCNEFGWGAPLRELSDATGMLDLVERVPEPSRWSYVYQGNAQVLDHVFVSPALGEAARAAHIVHRDAHRREGASDHDPVWAAFAPLP